MHNFWRTILSLSLLVQLALAHSHHDDLTEEELNLPVDAILWIHIFLQTTVWGIIFPIGMVLGLSRSRWHVPLQVSTEILSKYLLKCFGVDYWIRVNLWRLHSWSCTRRSSISFIGSRTIRFDTFHPYRISNCFGHLPEATHSRKIFTPVCRDTSWNHWQDVSYIELDTDFIWFHNV